MSWTLTKSKNSHDADADADDPASRSFEAMINTARLRLVAEHLRRRRARAGSR